ncbi:MBL fold metallo-hydrolase [Bacteroides eggerthii]|jgi:hydroxyacylglutathione hydrolase|uniref:MBL fold metallo-hydrolase n=1 Tax=Bacteroides eggerthii TaxID=28111 RepID=UPI0022E87DB8|nr:MBL fold metallo-hydrolase [Bacteroides eggerthii]
MKIKRFLNVPVPSNTYIVINGRRCVVIDPGSKKQDEVRDYIQNNGYSLDFIILTHEHFDHCWGVNYLLDYFNPKVIATRLCAEWIQIPQNYFNKLYYNSEEMYSVKQIDLTVEDIGMQLFWNDKIINFVDAKGHTNRGMCIEIDDCLFTGDTILFNTIPFLKKRYGASKEDLYNTISKIFKIYPSNMKVFPGHGECFILGEMQFFYKEYFQRNIDVWHC